MTLNRQNAAIVILALLGLTVAFTLGYNWQRLVPAASIVSTPAVTQSDPDTVPRVAVDPAPAANVFASRLPAVEQYQETGPTYTVEVIDHHGNRFEMSDSEYIGVLDATGRAPVIVGVRKLSTPWSPQTALQTQ
jgi:hypothetical protein